MAQWFSSYFPPSFPKSITIHLMKFSGAILDNDFQDCNGAKWKNTFPDLDFALLGYDILHGDPNAECDPGFKHPIFRADYSELAQSSEISPSPRSFASYSSSLP